MEDNGTSSNRWIPTSQWCGKLILPKSKDTRKIDGSIEIELLQTPKEHQSLKKKTMRLRLDAEWRDRVSIPINFDFLAKKSVDEDLIHPTRLDGWDSVSPLESLAGTRPEDDVIVELVDPSLEGNYLAIKKEPVQISGSEKALAKFLNKNPDGTWTIQHWNRSEQSFSGPTETVKVPGRKHLDPTGGKELNETGWYLYGDTDKSEKHVVRGLEPRSLFQINPDLLFDETAEALRFLKYQNWKKDTSIKGQTSQIHIYPRSHSGEFKIKQGDKALLLHLFGAVDGKAGRLGGHFSYGVAEAVKDDFTGELRLQVEYKQIYAHNIDGVISGSSQWHCYMGDTTIGKLAIRPVCDYLIYLPELFDDSCGESPWSILESRLAEMAARYRTGEGDGSSMVTTAQNCSQDSSQALYAAICDWKAAQKAGKLPPGTGRLAERLKQHITPFFGMAPRAWRRTAKRQRARLRKLRFIPAFKSWKTIVPRSNSDELAEAAVKSGIPVILLRSEIVGSNDDELLPAPPMRPW